MTKADPPLTTPDRLRCGTVRRPRLRHHSRWALAPLLLIVLAACDVFTDAATRIAYDIEAGEGRLDSAEGALYSIEHTTPSNSRVLLQGLERGINVHRDGAVPRRAALRDRDRMRGLIANSA